jgi:hypothetical protein
MDVVAGGGLKESCVKGANGQIFASDWEKGNASGAKGGSNARGFDVVRVAVERVVGRGWV